MISESYPTKEIEIDLQKYWLVLKRRWYIIAFICGLTTALAVAAATQKKLLYRAEAKLLFESSDQVSSLVGLEGGSREVKSLTDRNDPLDTQVEIFESIPVAQQVVEELQLEGSPGELLEPSAFLSSLDVRAIPGTDVLRVSYTSLDPVVAASVVNTIMDVFVQNNIQINRSAAVAAQDFILDQLPESESEVSEAEKELGRFKEANSIVDLDQEAQNTVGEISNLNNSLTQLRAQIAETTAKKSEIQQRLNLAPQEAYEVGLVSEAPGVQEVLQELQSVQSELATARTRYDEIHPEIAGLRRQESALSALLQSRIGLVLGAEQFSLPVDDLQSGELESGLISDFLQLDAEQAGLQERFQELLNAQSTQQARAQVLPGLERQQRELERKLNAAQTTYETLLSNFQQARVLENQNVGNARVVSPALVPQGSIATSDKTYLLAGGLIGFLLGIAVAFLIDFLDRSVKTVKEAQSLYGYPLLGVIPACRDRKINKYKDSDTPQILVREQQTVPALEAYQALQSNMKFSYLDRPLKTIAVTSAVESEGKSAVAANLAMTFAQLGHLVLLVDANMREPIQHHIWDISQMKGLSNFVAGQMSVKDAVVKKGPNLHILPAGAVPPNPLAILESKQMSSLLEVCKRSYDYIIIDTPALLGLADTLTVGRISDGLLVVMKPGAANVDKIKAAKSMLTQSHQRVLGLVANQIDVKDKADHYFYHSQEYVVNQDKRKSQDALTNDRENAVSNGHRR